MTAAPAEPTKRPLMFIVLSIATLILVTTTLLPLWHNPHWLVRGWDFPRLQIFTLALLALAAELAWLDRSRPAAWICMALTLAVAVYQAWWIAPYTAPWPNEVEFATAHDADQRISIMTANVLQENRDADALLALVAKYQPDVLVTLESDTWWQARLDTLETDMPYTLKEPLDNLYGMHLYSRLELEEAETMYLVQAGVPSMHCLLTLRSGVKVRMHFMHPAPPSPTENEESTQRDAELVIVARSVEGSPQPIIVTGDLNDVAWSETTRLFRKISGLLDPRVGRGMFNTFHAKYPFMRWPLDHIFHSKHFTLKHIERLPGIGSDHFPIYTELVYAPAAGADQDGLEADADDRSLADSIRAALGSNASDVPEPGAD